jgi:hypothetical protein
MSITTLRTIADARDPIRSVTQGSLQLLRDDPNGHIFVDYGSINVVKEFDSNGDNLMSAQIGPPNDLVIYRGFKCGWRALPYWGPSVVITSRSWDYAEVAMSWNGATEYDNWVIYGGQSEFTIDSILRIVLRNGFETTSTLNVAGVAYLQVVARKGDVNIRTSAPVSLN